MRAATGFIGLIVALLTWRADASNLWTSFRNGPQNTAVSAVEVRGLEARPAIRQVQQFNAGGLFWATAVIDDQDVAYVGSTNKNVYSFDPTGKLRWTYTLYDRADSLVDSAAVLAPNNLVVVPGGDGFLHALDRTTGQRKWDFKAHHTSDQDHQAGAIVNSFEGNVQLGPNNRLYAGDDNGYMYAVGLDGKEAWSFKTNMMVWSSPAFETQGRWMVFGSLDGSVYLLNPTTGEKLDAAKIGSDVKASPVVDAQNQIYFGASDFTFYSYKVENRKLVPRWKFAGARGEIYSSAALKNDRVVFSSLDGSIYALKTDGTLLWKYMTYSPIASSPLITRDDVVLFGAKNGKIYALDLKTGERIWSFATTEAARKSNLDASVSLTSDGTIVVGSYAGMVYRVPYEFCLKNRADSRCQFGGKNDDPAFVKDLPRSASTLLIQDEQGHLGAQIKAPVSLSALLKIQLVVIEDGVWQPGRAISSWGIRVTSKPRASFSVNVSSDGQYLDILPNQLLQPNTTYSLEISGTHYRQSTWLGDRFKFFGNQPFKGTVSFTTQATVPTDWTLLRSGTMGLRSMYLQQPQALDTYLPAALDGQGYLTKIFAIDEHAGSFLLHVMPALPKPDGSLLALPEPSKIFLMKGIAAGASFQLDGAVKISAMGGTVDFKQMTIRGVWPARGRNQMNSFYNEASCLSLQGSGSSYSFPMKLVNQICDGWLTLKGVGQIDFIHIEDSASDPGATVVQNADREVTLTATAAASLDRTVSIVVSNDGTVAEQAAVLLPKGQTSVSVKLKTAGLTSVFLNERLVSEVKSPSSLH